MAQNPVYDCLQRGYTPGGSDDGKCPGMGGVVCQKHESMAGWLVRVTAQESWYRLTRTARQHCKDWNCREPTVRYEPSSVYAFALAPFLVPFFATATFSSCAFINLGAFSQGLTCCVIFRLKAVVSRAAKGCVLGMPNFTRYERLSNS